MIDEFCLNGTIKEYRVVDLQKTLKDMDKSMAEVPAKYMCTSNSCPCPADTDFNLWAANETQVRMWKRTTASQPFVANGQYHTPLFKVSAGSTVTTYDNFWSCYEALSSSGNITNEYYKIDDRVKNVIESLEDEFTCNGVCDPGIFFFFRKIQNGPPTKACLKDFQEYVGRRPMAVGIVLLVSFFLTFCAWILTFSLCYRKKD
jgi:hypothetical protein